MSPEALDGSWQSFFGDLDEEARSLLRGLGNGQAGAAAGGTAAASETIDSIRAIMMIVPTACAAIWRPISIRWD